MTRSTGRARWLATLSLALVLALLPTPSTAADGATGDPDTALARLARTTASLPGGANAVALSSTLLGLLGQAIDALDDGPWVPASDPYALPLNLTPPLPIANTIRNRAYSDGCHARQDVRKAKGCTYGDPDSDFTVLLMGDSHGAMWLPAFEAIAARRGWRIFLLTKSACPPARLHRHRRRACLRRMRRVARERVQDHQAPQAGPGHRDLHLGLLHRRHPEAVLEALPRRVAQGLGGHDADHRALRGRGGGVQRHPLGGQGPHHAASSGIPTTCASARRPATRRFARTCDGPSSRRAKDADATFVDPSVLVCPDDRCPVVDGRYLVAYDISHLTPVYSRLLSRAAGGDAPHPRRVTARAGLLEAAAA